MHERQRSWFDRIPGKKQRVMTLLSFGPVLSTLRRGPAVLLAPVACVGGPEFRTRRQKTVLGDRRSTRGHKKGPGGARQSCSRVLTVVTRRLMRPTRRGRRVGRLSSRKPVKSASEIYDGRPCESVNYQRIRRIFHGNCATPLPVGSSAYLERARRKTGRGEARYRSGPFGTRTTYLL